MQRILLLLVACVFLVPAGNASAAGKRCNQTHGKELAHSTIVKVYKVKIGSKYRFYGCAKPRGPVIALTETFRGNAVKMVAASGAYVAFTRTIRAKDTIAVVDARTGRKRHGLFPPNGIEFDIDPATPQIGAARINTRGELVVAYIGLGEGNTTESTIYLYAFDARGFQQLLDRGRSSQVSMKSVKFNGEIVSWTNGGVARSAKIGSVPLSITSGQGPGTGTVTTTPDVGIVCRIAAAGASGICVGSFDPDAFVTVTATAPTGTPVGIRGGCSATHVPVAGEPASVAQCQVRMGFANSVSVVFG